MVNTPCSPLRVCVFKKRPREVIFCSKRVCGDLFPDIFLSFFGGWRGSSYKHSVLRQAMRLTDPSIMLLVVSLLLAPQTCFLFGDHPSFAWAWHTDRDDFPSERKPNSRCVFSAMKSCVGVARQNNWPPSAKKTETKRQTVVSWIVVSCKLKSSRRGVRWDNCLMAAGGTHLKLFHKLSSAETYCQLSHKLPRILWQNET